MGAFALGMNEEVRIKPEPNSSFSDELLDAASAQTPWDRLGGSGPRSPGDPAGKDASGNGCRDVLGLDVGI